MGSRLYVTNRTNIRTLLILVPRNEVRMCCDVSIKKVSKINIGL